MSKERLNTITRMLEAWNETDSFDEDIEKTALVEELLTEMKRLCADSEVASSNR